ncbi:Cell polarity protein alp11 [Spathaspora sp. JA1]|nr:Cell polarity protein alp11 [Spathaspora sp. JA1]
MSDINIFVTSDLTSSERRISPQWTLSYLKQKLELITGIKPENQILRYYPNQQSNEYTQFENFSPQRDETEFVSSLELKPYSRIHVIDQDPESAVNELAKQNDEEMADDEEAAAVEFKLSEDEYAKRENSVLQWKQTNKLGRFDPNYEVLQQKEQLENKEKISTMKIGDRCRIINIEGERRGVVKYIGKIDIIDQGKSDWIGIEFDEPVGRNDGSINGVKIFEARNNHGSFVKPKQVEVGDFPELDPFADDSDEEL